MKPATVEVKTICAPFSVKDVNKGARTFKGIASTWERDQGGDMIVKGAYARTLDHWRRGGRKIYLTDGHPEMADPGAPQVDRILGKLSAATETNEGLETEFSMVPGYAKADLALDMVEGDYLTGLSITYNAINPERDPPTKEFPSGGRTLREIKLFSIGLVIHPMNAGSHANPASVKSLLDAMRAGTLTEEEKAALLALPSDQKAALRALLDDSSAPAQGTPLADTPKELAPDDPARLALSARLRSLKRTQLVLT